MREVPTGNFVLIGGQIKFQTIDMRYQSLQQYLEERQQQAEIILSEMEKIIEFGDFRFVSPFGFRQKARRNKNQEMKNELFSLMEKMSSAKDKNELTHTHKEIMNILDNYKDLVFIDEGETALRKLTRVSHETDLYTFGGMLKEKINDELASYGDFREILREYINKAYSHLEAKFIAKEESERLSKNVEKKEPQGHTYDSKEQQLLEKKRRLAELKGKKELLMATYIKLHQTEPVENPIYKEHPNPVDGEISGYENISRFKNGTDQQRQELDEELRKIDEEIKSLEKEIKELTFKVEEQRRQAIAELAELSEEKKEENEPQKDNSGRRRF